ncbi:MAG: 4Fe-4S dicluster domain-containing protein [Anaerolineaceae bacterium]|nr:4Fe-4S dicluster domain-containing protein [Anaerolineaceae bacterium]
MLGDILKSLFKKPATQQYPYIREATPESLRGALQYDPNKCTGCQLCIKDCPANAIELITIDKANKRFVMRYHHDRCVFCSQCVENCRFKCLAMSNDQWELAAKTKQPFTVLYGREEDVQFLLEREANPNAAEPCPEG